jgi:hypothetical protein
MMGMDGSAVVVMCATENHVGCLYLTRLRLVNHLHINNMVINQTD